MSFHSLAGYYPLFLIVAPFVVPRVINYVLQWSVGQKRAGHGTKVRLVPGNHDVGHVEGSSRYFSFSTRKLLPCTSVSVFALVKLTVRRPFNIFTSMHPIPLASPAPFIQSLIKSYRLPKNYDTLLALLSSMDSRLIYAHFGHDTFLNCHGLCRPDSASDHLMFHAVRLAKTYLLLAIILSLANPRWKWWITSAASSGFVAEVAQLAITDIRTRSDGMPASVSLSKYCKNIASEKYRR